MASSVDAIIEADLAGRIVFDSDGSKLDEQLAGKRVLITGGASGLGDACCRRMVAAGAYVVIADKNEEMGKALEHELLSSPGGGDSTSPKVSFIAVDVANWTSQLELFAAALDFFPGREIDSLITCAAVKASPAWSLSPASPDMLRSEIDRARLAPLPTAGLDVNLTGTVDSVHIATTYCMWMHAREAAALPSEGKSIVLLGSTSGFRSLAGRIDYSVTKWGVRGLFRNLRTELQPHGIRVNLMAPFWVPTALTHHLVPELERQGVRTGKLVDVIDGIVRMVVDDRMDGRAIAVTAKGLTDICDDAAGRDGGTVMLELAREGWLPPAKSATLQT